MNIPYKVIDIEFVFEENFDGHIMWHDVIIPPNIGDIIEIDYVKYTVISRVWDIGGEWLKVYLKLNKET